MDDLNTIIRCLQQKKKAMLWTNKDIVERSGYSINTVGKIMRGENTNLYAFLDVCEVLGIEVRVV